LKNDVAYAGVVAVNSIFVGLGLAPGANFSYIFSGENFGENSAENFPPKMLGKMEFSAEKRF
jgi:hypothetical protein